MIGRALAGALVVLGVAAPVAMAQNPSTPPPPPGTSCRPTGFFTAPALPLEMVFDPTGAGDTFAGGFVGYLASAGREDESALRRAVIMGSAMASFCVEAFTRGRRPRAPRTHNVIAIGKYAASYNWRRRHVPVAIATCVTYLPAMSVAFTFKPALMFATGQVPVFAYASATPALAAAARFRPSVTCERMV